jgi:hypothetical protein
VGQNEQRGAAIIGNRSAKRIEHCAFRPSLERLVGGVSSLADQLMIEGVVVLPAQVAQLATHYPSRAVFLGGARLTLEDLDHSAGRSGYGHLPETLRRQIVEQVPRKSACIRQGAERLGYACVDMAVDFVQRLVQAALALTAGIAQ